MSHFTFVGMDHFHDRYPARYRVQHREVTKIYNTTIVNNRIIHGNNNTLINRGVPVDRVARASHQDIRPIRINADANGPRTPQLGRDGRSLAVYRPNLPTPRPGQAPRLVGEGVKPAPNFNLRTRVDENRARAVATRAPTGPYAPAVTRESRPIIGNRDVNRPDNVARDNRFNQPETEKPGSVIMRGPNNQPDRQVPIRGQNPAQTGPTELRHGPEFPPNSPNQPDRGNNPRVVTPPMTPGGQPYRGQQDGGRQNPSRDVNPPSATRSDVEQSQRQQRQLLQQQQQTFQQQQRDFQQQQRELQQQQRQQRDFQPQQPVTPRQEAPSRSFDVPRQQQPSYQPPIRSEGSPRMQESRPAPEMRSAPQYSAPARSDGGGRSGDGGGNRGGGGGNGNNWNNNNGGGNGRGR